MPYLSASEVVFHYEEALYQVLYLTLLLPCLSVSSRPRNMGFKGSNFFVTSLRTFLPFDTRRVCDS